MMRENPPKCCRGETENARDSGCRNRKRRRNNIDTTVDTSLNQQRRQPGSREGSAGRWRVSERQ